MQFIRQKRELSTQRPTSEQCKEFFKSYETAVIFHLTKQVEKREDRIPWSKEQNTELVKVERDVFLAGNYKAFLLFMDECRLCEKCAGNRVDCRFPVQARPSPESLAVDVFTTVRKQGYLIEVLTDVGETMNRYAFLMLE